MEILTVKIQGDGLLINNLFIASNPDSREYRAAKRWEAEGNTIDPEFTQAELDAQVVQAANAIEIELLKQLNLDSIDDIREWIAAQPDAPTTLVERENEAVAARAKLR